MTPSRFPRDLRDPRVRRYAGLVVLTGALLGLGLSQVIGTRLAPMQPLCSDARPAAMVIATRTTLQVDSGNDVIVAVRSCDARGIGELTLLVSSPPRAGSVPALSGDVDVLSAGDCHRDQASAGTVLLLCGSVAPRATRDITLSVVPHRIDSGTQLAVSAVDVLSGGLDHPAVLDATTTTLHAGQVSGGVGGWYVWLSGAVALLAGIDMARRGRSGVRWMIGLLFFQVLGWAVWIRDRTRWAVVPAGAPPVAVPEPRWVRRYSVAVGIGLPVVIVGVIVVALVGSMVTSHSSGLSPSAAVTPPPAPSSAAPAPTPCAGGTLPASLAGATRVLDLCASPPPTTLSLHVGDTLAILLPPGIQGVGSTVEIAAQSGTEEPLVDTSLGDASAALLLAHAPGTATVQVVPVCSALSTQCFEQHPLSFTVAVGP